MVVIELRQRRLKFLSFSRHIFRPYRISPYKECLHNAVISVGAFYRGILVELGFMDDTVHINFYSPGFPFPRRRKRTTKRFYYMWIILVGGKYFDVEGLNIKDGSLAFTTGYRIRAKQLQPREVPPRGNL